jgi:hypothetical protein
MSRDAGAALLVRRQQDSTKAENNSVEKIYFAQYSTLRRAGGLSNRNGAPLAGGRAAPRGAKGDPAVRRGDGAAATVDLCRKTMVLHCIT